ncbi:MAG: DUF5723 family protein [Bacteroidia bacterium]
MRTIIFSLLFIWASVAQAQLSNQRQWLADPVLQLAVHPAALADSSLPGISIHGNASLGLVGSAGLLDLYLQNDGFIDNDEKQVILGRMGDDNRFYYADNFGPIMIAGRLGKIPFSVGVDRYRNYGLTFNDARSLELLLRGNAVFAGERVEDNLGYHNLEADRLSLGTAVRLGKAKLGVRAHYLMGRRMTALDQFEYGLFTAEDGTQLTLDANYALYESTGDGSGLGVDLSFEMPVGKKLKLHANIFDLGTMSWDVREVVNNTQVDFRGINLNDLVDGGIPDIQLEDTLRRSLFPDSTNGTYSHALPARGQIGVQYELKKGRIVFVQLLGGIGDFAPGGRQPMAVVGYQRHGKVLSLGAQAFVGGTETYGFGGLGALHLHSKKGFHLDLVGEFQNIVGLALQSNGGLRGHLGLALGF